MLAKQRGKHIRVGAWEGAGQTALPMGSWGAGSVGGGQVSTNRLLRPEAPPSGRRSLACLLLYPHRALQASEGAREQP